MIFDIQVTTILLELRLHIMIVNTETTIEHRVFDLFNIMEQLVYF